MRILWLKTELLHPVDKGGRIRTYNMLRELKRDHEITYLTLDDGVAGPTERTLASEYCHELICVPHFTRPKFSPGFYVDLAANLFSSLPYFMQKYKSSGMHSQIQRLTTDNRFDVLVCDFLQPSVNVPRELNVPAVLFQHNVEAMIWKRHYEVQRNAVKRAYLYRQWQKSRAYEREACRRFDHVVAVSEADEQQMRVDYGITNVAAIPTGVDIDYFAPRTQVPREPNSLVFTGSMDWLPNEDAMQFFIRDVLPIIRNKIPTVKLTVVGRDPYPSLIEISKRDPNIIVTGRVDDVRPYIARAAVFVVPIRIGGGTRLKIYEAMSMGTPVVSTTVGAEGLPLTNEEHIVLADTPDKLATELVELLQDQARLQALGDRGAEFVRKNFGWSSVSDRFAAICRSVGI